MCATTVTTQPGGLETLEPRRLMAHHHVVLSTQWVPYAQAVHQNDAVNDYPAVNGAGVTVAVIDRGIDYNEPLLGGGIGKRRTVLTGVNFRDKSAALLDDYGHGTGVAGVIASAGYTFNGAYGQGVAPGVKLLDLKQESSAGVKAALDWVIKNADAYNIQVVNLTDFVTDVKVGAFNPTIYQAELKTIHDMGIFISTPAGNFDVGATPLPMTYPALSKYVTAVGGFDQSGGVWAGSRTGPALSLLGPADNVTMPYYLKNKNSVGYDRFDDNYDGTATLVNYARGTSWASAYVAGTAALIKQVAPNITPDQLRKVLRDSGTWITDPATGAKYPKLNIDAAIKLAIQRFVPATKQKRARAAKLTATTFSTTPIDHAKKDLEAEFVSASRPGLFA